MGSEANSRGLCPPTDPPIDVVVDSCKHEKVVKPTGSAVGSCKVLVIRFYFNMNHLFALVITRVLGFGLK